MAHELIATIVIRLPDDPQELAGQISAATQAWADLLKAVEKLTPEAKLSINETKARANGAKRGRKPRVVAPVTEPAAAA